MKSIIIYILINIVFCLNVFSDNYTTKARKVSELTTTEIEEVSDISNVDTILYVINDKRAYVNLVLSKSPIIININNIYNELCFDITNCREEPINNVVIVASINGNNYDIKINSPIDGIPSDEPSPFSCHTNSKVKIKTLYNIYNIKIEKIFVTYANGDTTTITSFDNTCYFCNPEEWKYSINNPLNPIN